MPTVYFTASSIDGFIVDDRDSLDWLLSRNIDADGPFGYRAFSDSVGALVMGATTYEWIVANESGNPVHTFAGDITELQPKLLQAAGYRDVWMVGGGEAAAQFVRAGFVDELIVSYAPCTLGTGGRLLPIHSEWQLVESGVNGDFVCARWRKA